MSDYFEYTDDNGTTINIEVDSGTAYMSMSGEDGDFVSVNFTEPEAIEIARHLLEKAGVDPKNGQPGNAEEASRKALYWLQEADEMFNEQYRMQSEAQQKLDREVQVWLDRNNDTREIDQEIRKAYLSEKRFWENYLLNKVSSLEKD